MIEPGHPFQCCQLDRLARLPGHPPMDQFGLVETVDGLGERVVVAVALATHGGLNAGFGQALGVADRHVLRTAVAVVDQGIFALRRTGVERLLERIEHEVGTHRTADPPADDSAGEHVDDKGNIHEALPSRHVSKIRDPELIGALGLEVAPDAIERAWRGGIGDGCPDRLATQDTAKPEPAHAQCPC